MFRQRYITGIDQNRANALGLIQPKAVTLFSGLGGSSKALRDLGFHVLAHDFMVEACATLGANGFDNVYYGDVRSIDYSDPIYDGVTVLEGGPPCQPFSQSHDGDGRYDPRDMIPEFIRAIDGLLPELFVMEEVQTLTWKRHADYLEKVEDDMRALGYRVEHRVLNAADYGIPQARKRLFVVGVREDIAQQRDEWITLFGDDVAYTTRPVTSPIYWPDAEDYTPITMAEALGWTLEDCRLRNEQAPESAHHPHARIWPMTRPSTTVVGSFRPEVQAAPGYRRAGDGPRQNSPGSVVTTLRERLILQDMPEDWVVCGSKSKQDLQVGNSVPCGLMRDIIDLNLA